MTIPNNMDKIFSPIKERIFKYIDNQRIEKEEFYKFTGIAASNFKGSGLKSELGGEKIVKILTNYPNINAEWLITGNGNMIKDDNIFAEPKATYLLKSDLNQELQRIPLYSLEASAGLVQLFQNQEDVLDYISIPNLPRCDGAVYIKGDSMYPLLKSGDIVMYKIMPDIREGIIWGEMYLLAVSIGGEDLTLVKYIQKSEEGKDFIKLVSQNQHHAPKDVHLEKIKGLALIKASVRINSMS